MNRAIEYVNSNVICFQKLFLWQTESLEEKSEAAAIDKPEDGIRTVTGSKVDKTPMLTNVLPVLTGNGIKNRAEKTHVRNLHDRKSRFQKSAAAAAATTTPHRGPAAGREDGRPTTKDTGRSSVAYTTQVPTSSLEVNGAGTTSTAVKRSGQIGSHQEVQTSVKQKEAFDTLVKPGIADVLQQQLSASISDDEDESEDESGHGAEQVASIRFH